MRKEYNDEQVAVAALKRSGAELSYTEAGPDWLRQLTGGDGNRVFDRVEKIILDSDCRAVTNDKKDTIALLKRLKHLQTITFVTYGLSAKWNVEIDSTDIERDLPSLAVQMVHPGDAYLG